MYRDGHIYRNLQFISPTAGDCFVYIDDQTIYQYDNDTHHLTIYKTLNDTYIPSEQSVYTSIPTNYTCNTSDFLGNLYSKYDFLTPVFMAMAIVFAIAIFYAAYRLIIYPWFRRI